MNKNRTAKLKNHREVRCSKTNSIILIVVTSFFITWLPNHALNMYMVLKPPSEWSPKVFRLNPFTQVSFSGKHFARRRSRDSNFYCNFRQGLKVGHEKSSILLTEQPSEYCHQRILSMTFVTNIDVKNILRF